MGCFDLGATQPSQPFTYQFIYLHLIILINMSHYSQILVKYGPIERIKFLGLPEDNHKQVLLIIVQETYRERSDFLTNAPDHWGPLRASLEFTVEEIKYLPPRSLYFNVEQSGAKAVNKNKTKNLHLHVSRYARQ